MWTVSQREPNAGVNIMRLIRQFPDRPERIGRCDQRLDRNKRDRGSVGFTLTSHVEWPNAPCSQTALCFKRSLSEHTSADLVLLQQLSIVNGPVLAALISMDKHLQRPNLTVVQGSIKGLDHQSTTNPRIKGPVDDTATEQIDRKGKTAPNAQCTDLVDFGCPAAV